MLAAAAEHHDHARAVVGLERQHRRLRVEPTLAGTGLPPRSRFWYTVSDAGNPTADRLDLATIAVRHPCRQMRVDVDLFDAAGRT